MRYYYYRPPFFFLIVLLITRDAACLQRVLLHIAFYRILCFIEFIAFLSDEIIILITSGCIDLEREFRIPFTLQTPLPPSPMEITNILLADSRLHACWFLRAANSCQKKKKESNKIATP